MMAVPCLVGPSMWPSVIEGVERAGRALAGAAGQPPGCESLGTRARVSAIEGVDAGGREGHGWSAW